MFPPEIFEKILYHCDGKTLKNARHVNHCLRDIVDYLTKDTDIWRWCCLSDIPEHELQQYLHKWIRDEDEDQKNKWLRLYENWLNWHDIDKNIEFEIELRGHHRRIVCVDAVGKYIALGFENGTVKVFDENFRYCKIYRHLNVPICSVSMVCEDGGAEPTDMLIYYGDRVYVDDFIENENFTPALFLDCYKFSSYKKFLCGVTIDGKITIVKVASDDVNKVKSIVMVTYVRIYTPETVTCCNLWDGVCTLLVDNKVKVIRYYDGSEGSLRSNIMATLKTKLEFSCLDEYDSPRDIRIFNGRIIISLTKCFNTLNHQIFELYILGNNNTHSKKMFIPWQTFTANITCMFLYGNTFLIGLTTGIVYFYEIHDWKMFDIGSYNFKQIVSMMAPILSMGAVESHGKRTFFVATSTKVNQITGYSVPSVEDEPADEEAGVVWIPAESLM